VGYLIHPYAYAPASGSACWPVPPWSQSWGHADRRAGLRPRPFVVHECGDDQHDRAGGAGQWSSYCAQPGGPQRAGPLPEKSAKVLGTAAQGVVLTVLGHTAASGGWFEVKGATVTGWISGAATLSAPGEFRAYSSAGFQRPVPRDLDRGGVSSGGAVFRAPTGPDNIVVTAAAAVAKLPQGRSGYGQEGSQQIVVCGVTSDLVIYQAAGTASTRSQEPRRPT